MKPDMILMAYRELYPDKAFPYMPTIKYSGKFRGFNANIRLRGPKLTVSLSKQWRGVSKDIQIGLIQDLLVRLTKVKANTTNMQLYNAFMRNVHLAVPKTKSDPVLDNAFQKLNNAFFAGMMEKPNFRWMDGTRTLGHYEYGTDTISISKHLKEPQLLEYVMYHEMLHKKHKFSSTPGRHRHHSKAFRDDEAKFPDAKEMERRLSRVARPKILRWFL